MTFIGRVFFVIAILFSTPNIAFSEIGNNQNLRIIVPFAPGGTTDVTARILAEGLTRITQKNVVVENRTGGNIAVAVEYVARQRSNNILLVTTSGIVTFRHYNPESNIDPIELLSPVSMLVQSPMILLVDRNFPADNLQDFLTVVRVNPNLYSYGVVGRGSSLGMAADTFFRISGISMQPIPYTGAAPATLDLVSGRISAIFDSTVIGVQTVQSGRARALAVTSLRRSRIDSNIPTMQELGINMDFNVWQGVFVSSAVSNEEKNRINSLIRRALNLPAIRERYERIGVEEILNTNVSMAEQIFQKEIIFWRQ